MRKVASIALALYLCSCGGGAKRVKPLTPRQISEQSRPAIVRVLVFRDGEDPERIGSGFIVSEDGKIATNLHVFTDIRRGVFTDVRIGLLDGRTIPVERVVAIDSARDLAILGIRAERLPILELGDSESVSPGDPVVAIGHPLGQSYTVSDGLISSWREVGTDGQSIRLLQISAPISVGSSGGPLFDRFGRVIGVNTAVSREGQNLNFAIPSNYLSPLLAINGAESLEQFAERFNKAIAEVAPEESPIVRKVPMHNVEDFRGCSREELERSRQAIQQAIEVGAPLYNRGDVEACFKVYRNTHQLLEGDNDLCKPIRDAFGQGLLRATTLDGWRPKAWALRDSFDGLLIVIFKLLEQP